MPGVVINVRWPTGAIVAGPGPEYPRWSACSHRAATWPPDPNDHYRPWMEQHVGRQGWDWDWTVGPSVDETKNYLTIKIRQQHAKYATIAAIRWS